MYSFQRRELKGRLWFPMVSQFVRIGRFSSKNTSCTCGVPQAPFLGQSSSIFVLHLSHLPVNRTTPVGNNMQTIHSFILLSPLKAFLKVYFLSKIVFLTFGPGSVITVWLLTQMKLTRFSSALAINSVLYPLSHVDVAGTSVQLPKRVKILGATLDQQLTFQDQFNTVFSAFFYCFTLFTNSFVAFS